MSAPIRPPKVIIGQDLSAEFEGDTLVLIQDVAIYDGSPSRIALSPEALKKLDAYLWMAAGVRQRAQEAGDA